MTWLAIGAAGAALLFIVLAIFFLWKMFGHRESFKSPLDPDWSWRFAVICLFAAILSGMVVVGAAAWAVWLC